jgi:peptidoglycan/LPS O-acetylase OafA/YrhL
MTAPVTVSTWRLGHRAALDGLRGVAILLVLVGHALGGAFGWPEFRAVGAAGVALFFTLSGFLITSILIERADSGRASLAQFYRERAVRLMPALLAMLVVFGSLELAVGYGWTDLPPVLLYYANWRTAAGDTLGVFGATWSLSVEEQFYFVWPVVLLASMRWRHGPAVVAVAGIIGSTALRFSLMSGPSGMDRVYFGSDTEAAALLIGCLLAWAAHRGLLRATRTPPWAVVAVAASLFGWTLASRPFAASVVVPTLVPLVAAWLIWSVCSTGTLAWAVLRYLGLRSYALYLWHYPLIVIVTSAAGPSLALSVVAVLLAGLMAELSWQLIETPARRFRNRPDRADEQPNRDRRAEPVTEPAGP